MNNIDNKREESKNTKEDIDERKILGIKIKDVKDGMFVIMGAFILSAIIVFFFKITTVQGISMQNTLHEGEKYVLSKVSYFNNTPEKGDIIVFERDDLSVRYLIKRVIGVEGDHIVIKDNQLYINDELVNESYINEPMETEDIDVVVPTGKVFAMGDNRNHSIDSRSPIIGFVDVKDEIVGKVLTKK